MIDLDVHLPAIQAGDALAFGRWLAGAEPGVRASLASFATTVDTEAVLQEAALRAWQLAPRIEADGRANTLLRWTVRVARNLAVSERRRLHAIPTSDETLEALAEPSPPRPPDPHLRTAIAQCRDKLPDQPARALAARLEHGASEPDDLLADRLSMRKNTFLQNISRARKLLAECLKGRGIDVAAELR
jgi:RNA polymerase sigma-70 factor (ECF subfamily)